jgi:hypothetical protein
MKEVNTQEKLILMAVFLVFTLATIVLVKPASSQMPLPTIFIRPDGSVYPSTVSIVQSGNTYTFTDDIYAAIKIQKSNIVFNGAGYTLSGPYNGTAMDVWLLGEGPSQLPEGTLAQFVIGIDLADNTVDGITIENLNINNFSIGMYIWTKNNSVTGNFVSENIVGILLSGSNQTVTKNYIANNERGLFFGFNNVGDVIPSDIVINNNHFENNVVQLNGCECKELNNTEPPHCWDNGGEGNFWSDYNGTDANGDGIGDTHYFIDELNMDRYPLMQSPVNLPVPAPEIPFVEIVFGFSVSVVLIVVVLAYRRRNKA